MIRVIARGLEFVCYGCVALSLYGWLVHCFYVCLVCLVCLVFSGWVVFCLLFGVSW